jgi:hypothetical protein
VQPQQEVLPPPQATVSPPLPLPPELAHQKVQINFTGPVHFHIDEVTLSLEALIEQLGDRIVAKNVNLGQAGIVGDKGHADHNIFNQNSPQLEAADLAQLAAAFAALRQAIKKADLASSEDHDVEIGDLKEAEIAAKAGEQSKVLEYLKASGQWALDFATKLGVEVAKDVLTSTLGLPKN